MKPRILIFLVAALLCTSCGTTRTVIPPPIVTTQASFDQNVANSGILYVDSQGFHVTKHYLARYDALAALYGSRLVPPVAAGNRDGITPEGDHFLFTAEARGRFAMMNRWRKAEIFGNP